MTWTGWLDLSEITDFIVHQLTTAMPNSTLKVTGASPDAAQKEGNCLIVYLFHIGEDPHQRNARFAGQRVQPIPFQPLAIELRYLVSAYAGTDFILEQQAMSIALRLFYETPILKMPNNRVRLTVTMQPESADELSRLWQSFTVPARVAAIYRVSVVFLAPPEPPPAPKPPTEWTVVADPTVSSSDRPPDVTPPAPGDPDVLAPDGDGVFTVHGAGFVSRATEVLIGTVGLQETDAPPAAGQFLVDPSGTSVQFRLPATLASGDYPVRIRNRYFEAKPVWRVVQV
jgi:hypothetical protein